MLPCLRKLFGSEEKEYIPNPKTDNDALLAALQTSYYKDRFVEGLIEVIQSDGLTPDESELLTRVELQITENLLKPGEQHGSKRMVNNQRLRP